MGCSFHAVPYILADFPKPASYAEAQKCHSLRYVAPRMPGSKLKKLKMSFPFLLLLRNRGARLASSQQSSIARTLSRRSGLKDDCGSAQCNSEPPGKMESRALGRTDDRDCLGARYDILIF